MQVKPCPFCYSTEAKVEVGLRKILRTHEVQVMCPKCGVRGPVFSDIEHGHDWAVQAWNQLARTVNWKEEEQA